ncbi:MAG: PhoU family transcriptional regulator [Cenarchaeum symbiont of Oopsacas minuta]|nr:PhoU family transcriptional regulator [Cenarchaeum symbiont of Oopsacas minuta]
MTKYVRRLQRIGSTTMVSLPKDWVDKNHLVKNTEVDVDVGVNSVSITTRTRTWPSSEIEITYPPIKDENIAASLTGAYLLGYDVIRIRSKSAIPADEREKIRSSMRRLVGMEIVEEDATTVDMQFLLDATTLNPQKILRRMSNIVLGMFEDISRCISSGNRSNLSTMENRDNEVNRQYFLLVRLIRSTMVDKRLHSAFNLENIDILDYRIAAHLLEDAGDTVVQLATALHVRSTPAAYLKKIQNVIEGFADMGKNIIDAFVSSNRKEAIVAIAQHKEFERRMQHLRSSVSGEKISVDYLDLLYLFERIERAWADIADLIKPVYTD